MEKIFYELVYELNNRPDWIWIPMRGLRELG
jgi:predicted trehalose synthase